MPVVGERVPAGHQLGSRGQGVLEPPEGTAPGDRAGQLIGPLFIAILASWWWLWGGHRHGLILTPAETHLLLPAPLRRREKERGRHENC